MKTIIKISALLPLLIFTSCVKMPKNSQQEESNNIQQNLNFNWKSTESKTINITEDSDIFNKDGDTIATNIKAGNYSITVPKLETLTIKKHNPSTKSDIVESRIFFPASQKNATIMFEDTFPYAGDMDMKIGRAHV